MALTMSGSEIAREIREGRQTATEALELHIAAIERVNPTINAVVAERYATAREEAKRADMRTRDGDLPPFHGVPITVKESFALTGMPNTAGLVARKGRLAVSDATAVARLRAAGAIPMGVTNVSELCMWLESHNCVYGRTNNPYDAGRIAGGSSGGEGAIVGAGASPMGLGADIGGSIRMPAFFCGAFGHKPTGGLVPGSGQFPIAENEALRYLTTGPIARRAEDLWPFLQVVAGPDGLDPMTREFELGDPSAVSMSALRVIDVRGNGLASVSDDLRAAQERVATHLSSRGARVSLERFELLARSFEMWAAMMTAAADTSFGVLMGDGQPIAAGREMIRWALGRSDHTFAAIGLALVEQIPLLHGARAAESIGLARRLQLEIEDAIGDGVMLYPSYTQVAPRHNRPLLTPWHPAYTALINVLELPSTQVPLGLDRDGLPLGVQVVARRGNDHVTIAVALELERAFGGWVPPAIAA